MRLKVMVAAVAVTAALMAAPATSSAQAIDVGATCHSILGSGTIALGAVDVNYCLAAVPSGCQTTNTINILNILRLRLGTCVDVAHLTVGGVAAVRPGGAALRNGHALRASRRARINRKRR